MATEHIVQLAKNAYPSDIAADTGYTVSWICKVLKRANKSRARKPRGQTSAIRPWILWLGAGGMKPSQIAKSLGVSRAYVYKILSDAC